MGDKTGFCRSSHITRMLIYNLYLQQKLTATENNDIRRSARIKKNLLVNSSSNNFLVQNSGCNKWQLVHMNTQFSAIILTSAD